MIVRCGLLVACPFCVSGILGAAKVAPFRCFPYSFLFILLFRAQALPNASDLAHTESHGTHRPYEPRSFASKRKWDGWKTGGSDSKSVQIIQGIFEILVFLRLRTIEGSSWVLVKGIVTLIVGLVFCLQWNSIAGWVVGVLLGMSLVTSGVTLVVLSLAVRNTMAAVLGGNNQYDSSAKEYWKIHSY